MTGQSAPHHTTNNSILTRSTTATRVYGSKRRRLGKEEQRTDTAVKATSSLLVPRRKSSLEHAADMALRSPSRRSGLTRSASFDTSPHSPSVYALNTQSSPLPISPTKRPEPSSQTSPIPSSPSAKGKRSRKLQATSPSPHGRRLRKAISDLTDNRSSILFEDRDDTSYESSPVASYLPSSPRKRLNLVSKLQTPSFTPENDSIDASTWTDEGENDGLASHNGTRSHPTRERVLLQSPSRSKSAFGRSVSSSETAIVIEPIASRKNFMAKLQESQEMDAEIEDVLDPEDVKAKFEELSRLQMSTYKRPTASPLSRTYSRTQFPKADETASSDLFSQHLLTIEHEMSDRDGTSLREEDRRTELHNDAKRDNSPTSEEKHIKSKRELLDSGEYRRFAEEVEYILEGFSPKLPVNVQRTSALDLAHRLLSSSFVAKARSYGYISKFWHALAAIEDGLVKIVLVGFVLILAGNSRDTEVLYMEETFTTTLMSTCNVTPDLLKAQGRATVPLRKSERAALEDVKTFLKQVDAVASFAGEDQGIQGLTLVALSRVFHHRTRFDQQVKDAVGQVGGIEVVLSTLKCMFDDQSGIASSLWSTSECLLSLLEALSFQHSLNVTLMIRNDEALALLLNIARQSQVAALDTRKQPSKALDCLMASLKVLVNLTHANAPGYRGFCALPGALSTILGTLVASDAKQFPVPEGTGSDSTDPQADVLLLCIGLLINVVEEDADNRATLSACGTNDTCPRQAQCALWCHCDHQKSGLAILLSTFQRHVANAQDANDQEHTQGMITGYLALLMGLLTRDKHNAAQLKQLASHDDLAHIQKLMDTSMAALDHSLSVD
ncbi:hypothetical protein BZG36_00231 [Bifiguratus adelaidae]|uniref:WAPL domain-containing protein n=1 Tax=Bifiguratus adelaidae TaxID=1938954 RepID=A0A261Y8I0_9FUNG|nr:hypothetical protein BZG36_00231 [Bifiguratus adelaidae]